MGGKPTAGSTTNFTENLTKKPNKDYFESYELDDKAGKAASYGSFTAPTTGIMAGSSRTRARKTSTST